MAIWQYRLFVIPEEEINSYFLNEDYLSEDAFNEIDWWKYKRIDEISLGDLISLLAESKSWSNNIYQLGNIESDCLEILFNKQKILEISIRVDLRNNYNSLIEAICKFGRRNALIFLNYNLKLLSPDEIILKEDISNYNLFDDFITKNQ
ncbi:hypothetical protein FA048_00015 [Pedobacter polaris]|uniref:Uncharacterized protein n=1 Tax=Pedobacter polaris TaxID=2571273 RepID=A0A4U1CXA9_9SPHI|nr:hypothetical protein [Pedobacter polaris]TKC12039.1 hypothetical protein FA048_00015 [Pedobacter polaris]